MSIRTEKVAELLKHQMSFILPKHVDTSDLGFVTVTEVRVTADLKLAKVYVSIFNPKITKQDALQKINLRKKEIRMALGHAVQLKFTPDIVFYLDDTMDKVQHIEEIFRQIHKDEHE